MGMQTQPTPRGSRASLLGGGSEIASEGDAKSVEGAKSVVADPNAEWSTRGTVFYVTGFGLGTYLLALIICEIMIRVLASIAE